MALATQGYVLRVSLTGQNGRRVQRVFELDGDSIATHAEAQAARDALVAALDPLTEAVISSVHLIEVQNEDTAVYGTGYTSDVATLVAKVDDTEDEYWTFQLPAPVNTIFLGATGPDNNVIDTGNADLNAFGELFNDGDDFQVSDGEHIIPVGGNQFVRGARISKGGNP